MQNIITYGSILLLFAVAFPFFLAAVDRQAEHECLQWQEQAKEYQDFYLSDWQKKQCESVGVQVKG